MANKKREELLNYALAIEEDVTIANTVTAREKLSENFLTKYLSNWKSYYDIYRCRPEKSKQAYQGRANLFVPYPYSMVETVHPRLVANKPKVIVAPRGSEDLNAAYHCQFLVDYYLDQMNFKKTFKNWVKVMLLYGLSVLKLDWIKEDGYEGPRAQVIDIASGDFRFDPTAQDIGDSWCIHIYDEPLGKVKANKNYKNTDLVKEGQIGEERMQRLRSLGISASRDTSVKMVKISEYWGPYDLNKDGIEENCKIVVANDTIVLQAISNPLPHGRNPFIGIVDTAVPNEAVGIGEIEPIISATYELNDLRNQRMDNVTLILHRMFKVFKGADVNEAELVWRPGGVVHVGDMEGVQPIDVPDVTKSSYNEETMIKSDIELASGVQDFTPVLQKNYSAAETTARGMALQQELANPRFQVKLDNIEDGMIEFGKQLVALIYKYMPAKVEIRLMEGGNYAWKKLNRSDVKGEFDIKIEMGTTQPQNRLTRRAEARELVATLSPISQVYPEGIDKLRRAVNFLFDTYDIPESIKEEINQPATAPINPQIAGGMANAGMQSVYGQMGKTLGGAMGNYQPTEIQGLAEGNQAPQGPAGI